MRLRGLALHWLIASLPLLAVLAVVLATVGNGDEAYRFFKVHRREHPLAKAAFRFVTDWGNWFFYLVYGYFLIKGLVSKNKRLVRLSLTYLAVQLVISLLLNRLLKISIGKPRPGEGGLFQPFSLEGTHHSMPSGHTCEITGAAMPFAMIWRRHGLSLAMGLVIALMGFSRIYVGMHFASDVFFGWLLGSCAGLAISLFGWDETR